MLVSLRAVGHSRDEPDYPPRLQPGRGCDGLAYLFAGCRLVVGAGYGVERYFAHVRDHGIESLVLARCRRCQQRAQQERLRVAEGDLWEYFSVPQRFAADGFLLTGIIERLSYLDTARLLRLIHRSLSPGKPVALITMSTSAHLDSILEPQEPAEDRRLYSPEFICELAQLCGFEVVGVSFL
jgi:hypothetical protein